MLYNSYIFILCFLPLTLAGYYFLNNRKKYQLALIWLFLMSLWFYGYFHITYLILMLVSIGFNFIIARMILRNSKKLYKKLFVTGGLLGNLGVLFYFKYFNFFVDNINWVFYSNYQIEKILLPLGISFFTFQQISYIVDSYKDAELKKDSLLDYAVFVTFFPQLVAGPIVLHHEVIPQFQNLENRSWDYEAMAKGILFFSIGLAKKVLIADTFGLAANWGFSNIPSLDTISAFIVMLSYTFQIYFDFSGYCDMAAGIAKMFRIDLPMNFNSPYKAYSILEFWEKWHMTLTRFFRTYIYIPLGGSRKGKCRTYLNIFLIFLISGLWHGAQWAFIFWGILHGIANILTRVFQKQWKKLHTAVQWFLTFGFVNVTWVYFRAESIAKGNDFLKRLVSLEFTNIDKMLIKCFETEEWNLVQNIVGMKSEKWSLYHMILWIGIAFLMILNMRNTKEYIDTCEMKVSNALLAAGLMVWAVFSLSGVSTFLYFNF